MIQLKFAMHLSIRPVKIDILLCLLLIFVSSCSKNYPDITPLSIQRGECVFQGIDKNQKRCEFIYSVPKNYKPQQSMPLLIALHGSGDNMLAFFDLFKPVTDSTGYVLLAVQGLRRYDSGFGWSWDKNGEISILTCLDIIRQQVHIDQNRIFILGFSSGGKMAYRIVTAHAIIFKGLALLSAPLSGEDIVDSPWHLGHMRVFIGRGDHEQKYITETQTLVTILIKYCEKVKYRIYANTGHSLPDPKEKAIQEILDFFLSSP